VGKAIINHYVIIDPIEVQEQTLLVLKLKKMVLTIFVAAKNLYRNHIVMDLIKNYKGMVSIDDIIPFFV